MVILIEVFAYFFLRLYKTGLGEIKYFQNELTNVEVRALALRSALDHADAATSAAILLKLSDTERNYLKKDETTPDLERAKAQHDAVESVLERLAKLLAPLKGPSE